ncbi:CHAT domain protein [Candidatus Magnetomorum sp. HK-1]|nr:CHAT domain protein [Candidatus Magnetomorum sp. HK-1]
MQKVHLKISAVKDRNDSIHQIRYEDLSSNGSIYENFFVNTIADYQEIEALCKSIFDLVTFSTQKKISNDDLVEIRNKCSLLSSLLFGKKIHQLTNILFKDERIQYLILDIDDELSNIPWENISLNKQFLWEKFYIGRILKVDGADASLCNQSQKCSSDNEFKMWIVANPTNDLKKASLEAKELSNIIKPLSNIGLYLDTEVKVNQFKEDIRSNWQIFHFAGHVAYKKSSVIKAGIELSDDFIFSDDVISLSDSTELPGLIFINACHSAHSQVVNVEMVNLAKAFIQGKPKHFIGTFCELHDSQAKDFAVHFYKRLLLEKMTVAESLYHARRLLYLKKNIACLNYVMYGDPDFSYIPVASTKEPPKPFVVKLKHISLIVLIAVVSYIVFICLDRHTEKKTSPVVYVKNEYLVENDIWTSKELNLAIMIDKKLKNKDDILALHSISQYIGEMYKRVKLVERVHIDLLIEEYERFQKGLIDPQKGEKISLKPVDIFVYMSTITDMNQKIALMKMFYYKDGLNFALPDVEIKPGRITLQEKYLAKPIISKIKEKYPIRGLISKIKDDIIHINIGTAVGVGTGMKFNVINNKIVLKVKYVEESKSHAEVIVGKAMSIKKGWKVCEVNE